MAQRAANRGILWTHSEFFHADEVFAAAVLTALGYVSRIIRSRDLSNGKHAKFAVDIGGAFDPARGLFDHHQKGGAGVRSNGVPLASAGLVWGAHGREFCDMFLPRHQFSTPRLVADVDRMLVQGLDVLDIRPEGIKETLLGEERISVCGLKDSIESFNPMPGVDSLEPEYRDRCFGAAIDHVLPVLKNYAARALARQYAPGIVASAKVEGNIMFLPVYCEWQSAVIRYHPNIQYVVYEGTDGDWHCRAVPVSPGSHVVNMPMPVEWAAKRDEELQAITGVPDAVYCHANRFICGARSRDSAAALARLSFAAQ